MRWLIVALLLVATAPAWAHKPSDAHLQIVVSGDRLGGSLAVALRDLDGALDLDADGNGDITWAEVEAAAPRINAYESERLLVAGCTLRFGVGALVEFSDGAYWTVGLEGRCSGAPDHLWVTYKLLFDIDAQHRGIVQLVAAHATATVVARSAKPIELELGTTSPAGFAKQGLWHALTVPQHLLCLVLLLLPLTRRRVAARVTGAFLLAALTTLALTSTGVIHLPGQLVELALAVAAIVASAINLLDIPDRFDLGFELGLVNGLGFALWLDELGAPSHHLAPVVGFGLGVIAGLALIATAVTAIVTTVRIPRRAILVISAAGAILATLWTLQV